MTTSSLHSPGFWDHMPPAHRLNIVMNDGWVAEEEPLAEQTLPARAVRRSNTNAWILGLAITATGAAIAVAVANGHDPRTLGSKVMADVKSFGNRDGDNKPAEAPDTAPAVAPATTTADASQPGSQPAPAAVEAAPQVAQADTTPAPAATPPAAQVSQQPLPVIAPAAGRSSSSTTTSNRAARAATTVVTPTVAAAPAVVLPTPAPQQLARLSASTTATQELRASDVPAQMAPVNPVTPVTPISPTQPIVPIVPTPPMTLPASAPLAVVPAPAQLPASSPSQAQIASSATGGDATTH